MKTRSKIRALVHFFISLNQGVQKRRSEHPCSVAGLGSESPLHAAVLNACTLLRPASPASSPCYVHRLTRRCGDCQFKVLSLRKEKKKKKSIWFYWHRRKQMAAQERGSSVRCQSPITSRPCSARMCCDVLPGHLIWLLFQRG